MTITERARRPLLRRTPGLGIWLTSERATSEPIGVHLLNHVRGEPQVQVGYLLLPGLLEPQLCH